MTISLVAIMLELTGGMTYIVPFMIAAPWENGVRFFFDAENSFLRWKKGGGFTDIGFHSKVFGI